MSDLKKIFVTGASGFVGKHMLQELAGWEYEVGCLIKTEDEESVVDKYNVTSYIGDIRDADRMKEVLKSYDAVIHLAAILGIPNPELNYAVNMDGTKNVVDACKENGINRIISFSSVSAGRENTSAYGLSKKKADEIVLNSGLNGTVLRTEMIYGNGSRGVNKIRNQLKVMPFFIPMVGFGNVLRQPVFVRDVARVTVKTLENTRSFNKLYAIAGKDVLKLRDFVFLIASEFGVKKRILPIPKSIAIAIALTLEKIFEKPPFTYDNVLGLTVSTELDITEAVEELGFSPMSIEEGIKQAISELQNDIK